MTPYYDRAGITIYCGDCLEVMQTLPDNCIDSIITDPPYGLQFMGKNWDKLWRNKTNADKDYQDKNSGKLTSRQRNLPDYSSTDQEAMQRWHYEWAKEALRIAKPGATLMAFGGTRTYHRLTCAIEDAGWEIRDCIMWVYGSGFPKSHNVSKAIDKRAGTERDGEVRIWKGGQRSNGIMGNNNGTQTREIYDTPATPLAAKFDGWGTALKPAYEPIVVAMKPMHGSYAENAEAWGVAGLNIDGGRVGYASGETPESVNKNSGISGGIFGNGKSTRVETRGRFPANIIHDNSDEVLAEFAKAGVTNSSNRPRDNRNDNKGYTCYGNYGGDTVTRGHNDSDTPARFFQQCPPDPTAHPEAARFRYCPKAPQSERQTPGNNHPTQKPLSLMRYLCKLTKTPTGGVVLDPFGGSGTTGLAAIAEGRQAIIIEKEEDYCEIIRLRIAERTGDEIQIKETVISERETAKQMTLW
jgi:site-specific DNA-methyltransferase (adenine-specific)